MSHKCYGRIAPNVCCWHFRDMISNAVGFRLLDKS